MSEPNQKRRGNPAMRAGGPSLNPGGRPRRGESLADLMRVAMPRQWIAERVRDLATTAESEAVRLAALQMVTERTEGRVTERHELVAGQADEDEDAVDYDALPLDTLRALERLDEERDRILAGAGVLALSAASTGVKPVRVGTE